MTTETVVLLLNLLNTKQDPIETMDQIYVVLDSKREAGTYKARKIFEEIQLTSLKTKLSPEFLLAIAITESDLDPKATLHAKIGSKQTAIDGGLMGVRCTIQGRPTIEKRCVSGVAKGLRLVDAFSLRTNLEIASRFLVQLRDTPTIVWSNGKRQTCRHTNHGWFAHYNWGLRVFSRGHAAGYSQRVAAISEAIADLTGGYVPEIAGVRRVANAKSRAIQSLQD